MGNSGIIYCYKNLVTGKCYIGQTVDLKKRIRTHKSLAYGSSSSCTAFYNAIKKYGYDSFEFSILADGIAPGSELDARESEYISLLNTVSPNGYNLRSGGGARHYISEESRKRIAVSNKKKWDNPEFSEKRLEKLKSKEYSDFLKSRIAAIPKEKREENQRRATKAQAEKNAPIVARRRRVREVLELITKAERKRYHATEEYKALRRANRPERKHVPNIAQSVPVFCITNGVTYLSATKAAEALSLDQGCISKIIRGDGHSTGGYYFRKATDAESRKVKSEALCTL